MTNRMPDGLFLDNNGMLTLVPSDTPLFICMCTNEEGKNIYSRKEEECGDCLCMTKRVGMDLHGKIMTL